MKFLRLVLILPVGLAGPSGQAAGEPTTADEILDFATAQQEQCESFVANLEQSLWTTDGMVSLRGQIQFQKPARMRLELRQTIAGRETTTTVVMGDDRVLWQQLDMPGRVQVMKMDFHSLPADAPLRDPTTEVDPRRQLARARQLYRHDRLPDAELRGQTMYVLAGHPRPSSPETPAAASATNRVGPHRLYIGRRDGFTHRVEHYDASGTGMVLRVDFHDLQRNVAMDAARFRYVPPPAAAVVDVSALWRQMPPLPVSRHAPR
jgi:outer membrane lipoprotein-sorting protein